MGQRVSPYFKDYMVRNGYCTGRETVLEPEDGSYVVLKAQIDLAAVGSFAVVCHLQ